MVLAFNSRFVAKRGEAAFTFNEGIWGSARIDLCSTPCLPDNLGIHYGWARPGFMEKMLLPATG